MKKIVITIPSDSLNLSCEFLDEENKNLYWTDMSLEERLNLITVLDTFREFFWKNVRND